MLNKEVKTYLEKLDYGQKNHLSYRGEHSIAKEIKNILANDTDYKLTSEDIAEQIAFDFMAEHPNDNSGWRTYYGPMFVLPNQKGQMVEYPSLKRVDEETLNYWAKRAKETKNPILSSRYADLVIDFFSKIINKKPDIELFHIAINSNIEICKKLLMHPLDCKKKIKRVLNLCLKINDKERLSKAINTITELEEKVAEDSKPGLWGFAFKWLLLDFKDKIDISVKEKKLVSDLESKLRKLEKDPWSVEHAVSLLAEYYSNESDEKNLMRVLGVLENSFRKNKHINSDALLKIHSFVKMHEIYQKYRDKGFKGATLATNRISQEIGQLNLNWKKSLKKIETRVEVKNEEISKFLTTIFGKENEYQLAEILSRIVIKFLPRQEKIEEQLKKVSGEYPLQFLCTTQIISENGYPIAKLESLNSDYENNFKNYANRVLQFNSGLLSITMDELKERISKEEFIDYFNNSLLFQNEDKDYIKYAFNAYWNEEFLISSYLFIPLIESAIRELVRLCGGIILKPNDVGGYDRLSLNVLLEKQGFILQKVFSTIGYDVPFYFRLVLTEKLGMNLRNNFAHGLEKKTFFSRDASDRLFHILLCLSLVKEKEQKTNNMT